MDVRGMALMAVAALALATARPDSSADPFAEFTPPASSRFT